MSRQTSIEAIGIITASGVLGEMQLKVFSLLKEYGPMTATELFVKARDIYGDSIARESYHKRLSELKEFGSAIDREKRPCLVTNMNAIVWEATNQTPVKPTKVEKLKKQISILESKLSRLKESLAEEL